MKPETHDTLRQADFCSADVPAGAGAGSIPEKAPFEWLIVFCLIVGSCLYLLLFYNYISFYPDEGVILQGAQRIVNGEVLYRDFFSFFTPGSYYWTALLFKTFGSSILVARTALVVYGGIFSAITYLLSRRLCSRTTSLFTAYLLTLVCLPYRFVTLHNWDSTVWACFALYFSVRFLETPRSVLAAAAAGSLSLTCLVEQSKGAGLAVGLACGFALVLILDRSRGFKLRHLWAAMAAFALPVLITIAYFAMRGAVPQMISDWFWPLSHYSTANKLPYGWLELQPSTQQQISSEPLGIRLFILFMLSPFVLVAALPIISVIFLGASIFRLRLGKISTIAGDYSVIVSAALAGLLLSTLISRPDLSHILFLGPLFILPLAWSLEGSGIPSRFWTSLRAPFALYLFLSFTTLGMSLLWVPLNAHSVVRTPRGVLKAEEPDAVLEEIEARVRPGGKIYIYGYQPIYYYLSATSNATGYEFLMPGMHTPAQFDQAQRELAESHSPAVVFQQSFAEMIPLFWPSIPAKTFAERDALFKYILAGYKPCKSLTSALSWHFVFMVRKDLSCDGML